MGRDITDFLSGRNNQPNVPQGMRFTPLPGQQLPSVGQQVLQQLGARLANAVKPNPFTTGAAAITQLNPFAILGAKEQALPIEPQKMNPFERFMTGLKTPVSQADVEKLFPRPINEQTALGLPSIIPLQDYAKTIEDAKTRKAEQEISYLKYGAQKKEQKLDNEIKIYQARLAAGYTQREAFEGLFELQKYLGVKDISTVPNIPTPKAQAELTKAGILTPESKAQLIKDAWSKAEKFKKQALNEGELSDANIQWAGWKAMAQHLQNPNATSITAQKAFDDASDSKRLAIGKKITLRGQDITAKHNKTMEYLKTIDQKIALAKQKNKPTANLENQKSLIKSRDLNNLLKMKKENSVIIKKPFGETETQYYDPELARQIDDAIKKLGGEIMQKVGSVKLDEGVLNTIRGYQKSGQSLEAIKSALIKKFGAEKAQAYIGAM